MGYRLPSPASAGRVVQEQAVGAVIDWTVGIIHVVISLLLILLILIHAGRGGGLSDMFGGGLTSGASLAAERNLDRITVMAGIAFAFTTIILALSL